MNSVQEDLFTLEEEETTKDLNENFLKDTYDYDIRFFIHEKISLVEYNVVHVRIASNSFTESQISSIASFTSSVVLNLPSPILIAS